MSKNKHKKLLYRREYTSIIALSYGSTGISLC